MFNLQQHLRDVPHSAEARQTGSLDLLKHSLHRGYFRITSTRTAVTGTRERELHVNGTLHRCDHHDLTPRYRGYDT